MNSYSSSADIVKYRLHFHQQNEIKLIIHLRDKIQKIYSRIDQHVIIIFSTDNTILCVISTHD